ncbi:MAG: DMT family transporter [Bdellovibrionales bacterium]|nr:DMT family transporter [Bdellovibrionales bacterium]
MGSFLVIASSFGFATLGIFGKLAFAAGFSRNLALFYRFLFALPLMVLLVFSTKGGRPPLKTLFVSFGLGVIGIGVEASLFFVTLEHFGAALTGIFLYLYPAFVALISHFFLKERMGLRGGVLVGVALIGSVLTAGVFGGSSSTAISPLSDPTGLIAGLLTGGWYAVYILVGNRVMRDSDPLWVSSGVVAGSLFAFAILAGAEILNGAPAFPESGKQASLAIAGLSVFSTVLPFATLYAGMKRVGAVRAALLSTLELVFTLGLAAFFLDEILTPSQWVGAALILLSVLLTSRHGRE